MEQQQLKCPFNRQPCMENACMLWGDLIQRQPGPIVGMGKQAEIEGCTFVLIFLVLVTSGGPGPPPPPLPRRPFIPS